MRCFKIGLKNIIKNLPGIKQYNEKFSSLYTRLDNMENMLKSMEKRQIQAYMDIMQKDNGKGYVYDRIRSITDRLRVFDAPVSYIRTGRDYDGGYVMADCFSDCTVAYSLGICDDVSWDKDMAERNIDVYMYDHTIDGLPEQDTRFHFFKTGLAGEDSGNLKTLGTIIRENDHENNKNMILKMDIEGWEWEVINQTDCISQFSQIAVELHGLCDFDNKNIIPALDKLNETHIPVHIHANNCSPVMFFGGLVLPDALEVTYLRKTDFEFSENTRSFPTELDMVNDPSKPEIILDF